MSDNGYALPLKPETGVISTTINIIEDRCKGCGFCIDFCPRDVLEFSEEFNPKGYHPPRVRDPEACVGCGLCEMLCPEFAIFVVGETEVETP